MGLQLVFGGNGLADGAGDFVDVGFALAAGEFVGDDEALFAVYVAGEGGAHAGGEGGVAVFDGVFDVLGVVVAAANDDEVFDPAGDVELVVVDEAEVAGAQVGAVAGVVEVGLEGGGGFTRPGPVALGDVGAADPDFADFVRGAEGAGVGMDDGQGFVEEGLAATDEGLAVGGGGGGGHNLVLGEAGAVEAEADRPGGAFAAGDDEGGFGQAVGGVEGVGAEAVGGEFGGELG